MSLVIGVLLLNELEWLPKLWEQHCDWPDVAKFVFVEAADVSYAEANPDCVTSIGLSVDGTTEWLDKLAKSDSRVEVIHHGFSSATNPAQGKCAARNRYLEVANEVKPDFVYVVDADEMYTKASQHSINKLIYPQLKQGGYTGFIFGMRSIWRPPSIADQPLFQYEAVGCLWSVPICRGWRWLPGMKYSGDHNSPCDRTGKPMNASMMRFDKMSNCPECLHMGFTASLRSRVAKRRYYQLRGEGTTDHRQKYVDCRCFYEGYQPGDTPPHGARIIPYIGAIPEVFQ